MNNFWKNKRVLITGGKGFLGRVTSNKLSGLGADVYPIGSRNYDLRNMDEARHAVVSSEAEIVIHLAARVSGIAGNMLEPASHFYDNVTMGINMLEVCRKRGVDKLVLIGSVCSYPLNARLPLEESAILDGQPEKTNGPYGIAKRMLITGSRAYHEQYGLPSINLILANLYGPGDNFDPQTSHVIPSIVRKVVKAQRAERDKVVLWGSGKATRDFLYVDDAADAIILAAEKYNKIDPINVGSGVEHSISAVARMVAKVADWDGQFEWDVSQPEGQDRRILNTTRFTLQMNWKPKIGLEEGLTRTVQNYKETTL